MAETTPTKAANRRKSIVQFLSPSKLDVTEEENDDAAEKIKNKEIRENDSRRKSLSARDFITTSQEPAEESEEKPQAATFARRASRRLSRSTRRLAPEQLEELFRNCIKLSTENKINKQNSWNLHLIEHMQEVIETTSVGQTNQNFQVASCTLDAGVKIYSSRVDYVHHETYKMLTGLSRAGDKKAAQESDEENENGEKSKSEDGEKGEEAGEKSEKPKKKKSRSGGCTIEANVNNINMKRIELTNTIEPLFHQVNTDPGSAKSLLLNNLCINEGCSLILDKAAFMVSLAPSLDLHIQDEQSVYVATQAQKVNHKSEHETTEEGELSEFPEESGAPLLGDDSHEGHLDVPSQPPTLADTLEEVQIQPDLISVPQHEIVINMNQQAAPEPDDDDDDDNLFTAGFGDDGGALDDPEDAGDGSTEDPASGASAPAGEEEKEKAAVSTAALAESIDADNEYSYLDFAKINKYNWSSVSHWKVKSQSKKSQTDKKSKKEKEVFLIGYGDLEGVDFKEAFAVSDSDTANTLSDKVIKADNRKAYLMSANVQYDLSMLLQPFNISSIKIVSQPESGEQVVVFEKPATIITGDGEGANDDDDDDDDNDNFPLGGGDALPEFEEVVVAQAAEYELPGVVREVTVDTAEAPLQMPVLPSEPEHVEINPNEEPKQISLIAAPKTVEKIKIHYETKPIKVDVKALKDHLWEELRTTQSVSNEKTFSQMVSSLEREKARQKQQASKTKTRNSPNDFADVSLPFAFICLLHLANEQNLEIESRADMSDFVIRVPEHE